LTAVAQLVPKQWRTFFSLCGRIPGTVSRGEDTDHAGSQPDRAGTSLVFTQTSVAEGPLCLTQTECGASGNTVGARPKTRFIKRLPSEPRCLSPRDLCRHNGVAFSVYRQPLASSPVMRTARTKQVHSRPKPADMRLVFTQTSRAEALPLFDTNQNRTTANRSDGRPQNPVHHTLIHSLACRRAICVKTTGLLFSLCA
jgi:hypothetical protein